MQRSLPQHLPSTKQPCGRGCCGGQMQRAQQVMVLQCRAGSKAHAGRQEGRPPNQAQVGRTPAAAGVGHGVGPRQGRLRGHHQARPNLRHFCSLRAEPQQLSCLGLTIVRRKLGRQKCPRLCACRHKYFNTNNLWVNLDKLQQTLNEEVGRPRPCDAPPEARCTAGLRSLRARPLTHAAGSCACGCARPRWRRRAARRAACSSCR